MERATKLLHYGAVARPGPANPPVVRASTILHDTVEQYRDTKRRREEDEFVLSYGRRGTTSAHAVMQAVADLEGAATTYLFPTGVAALAGAIGAFLGADEHALVIDTVFSPTRRIFDKLMARYGAGVDYIPWDAMSLDGYLRDNTRLLFLEAPGSQTFEVADLRALSASARAAGVVTIADNTYGSGWLSRPLDLGCDVSVIAGTKYLSGHADVMMGAVSANREYAATLRDHVLTTGQTLSPDEAYNTLRGMRTMGLRFERHDRTAMQLVRWFQARPEVVRVLHPGIKSHPGHAVWKRDFTGAAGLFSVEFVPGFERKMESFIDRLKLFGVGSSWGGFESLAMPIKPYTERTFKPSASVGPMARFHAGLEDEDDLLADLEAAMAGANGDAASSPDDN